MNIVTRGMSTGNREGRVIQTYDSGPGRSDIYTSLVGMIGFQKDEIMGQEHDVPLFLSIGGPSGAGKTELGAMYAQESGLRYNIVTLAREAGADIDLETLRRDLGIAEGEIIYTRLIPKFNTRQPRPGEHHGIDAYFIALDELTDREEAGNLLFTYQYPDKEDGNWYGVPKSIFWPLQKGRDSVMTFTGYDSFSQSFDVHPNTVPVWMDSNPEAIEKHISERPASTDHETLQRLESFRYDCQKFWEHRHEVPYSISVEDIAKLRPSEDKTRVVLHELDGPLRQLRAITSWERYLVSHGIGTDGDIQKKYDVFVDTVVKSLANGQSSDELSDRLRSGHPVPLLDREKDRALLEHYSSESEVTMQLLDNLVQDVNLVGVFDANGRRTLVLSPYESATRLSDGRTDKHIIVDLLRKKLNGYGTSRSRSAPGSYSSTSTVSGVEFSRPVDEALFAYLTSDHVPVTDLERPRAVNVVFSSTPAVMGADEFRPLTVDDVVERLHQSRLAGHDASHSARAFGLRNLTLTS